MAVASVILIDDDPALRGTLVDVLVEAGYAVRVAASGREGLDLFARQPSDVVVTDIYMPDMDGIELIRALRDRDLVTPILAMSGKQGDASFLDAAREFGATWVIRKPFRGTEFLRALDTCVNGAPDGH